VRLILFVKLGAIGDVVQAAVALSIFRKMNSSVKVDWVVGKSQAELISYFSVADNIVEVSESNIYSGNIFSRMLYILDVNKLLRHHEKLYDKIITAYSDRRYGLLTAFVYAKSKCSFSTKYERPCPIHHRSRVFEYLRLMTGNDGANAVDISAETLFLGQRVLGKPLPEMSVKQLSSLPDRYVVLIPGGAKNMLSDDDVRRWPINHYRSLAKILIDRGYTVLIVGGPSDIWVREKLQGIMYEDWIGRTSLIEMLHLLARAEGIVTHDTGPMHMACLTRTPLIALFGPTPANACVPFGRLYTTVLHAGNKVACSPCYDGKNYAKCDNHECMKYITVQEVQAALLNIINHDK
jgi:heptosyltransferase II